MNEVVGLMVAVSFINREIDAAKVLPGKKDQEELIRKNLVNFLKKPSQHNVRKTCKA